MIWLVNADEDSVIGQDLLGHIQISTNQRYCNMSGLREMVALSKEGDGRGGEES